MYVFIYVYVCMYVVRDVLRCILVLWGGVCRHACNLMQGARGVRMDLMRCRMYNVLGMHDGFRDVL